MRVDKRDGTGGAVHAVGERLVEAAGPSQRSGGELSADGRSSGSEGGKAGSLHVIDGEIEEFAR